MIATDGRSLAVVLVGALADAAVAVDADERVVAWNSAATSLPGIATPSAAGRTIAELALADLPGCTRLPLAASSADGAVAILAWNADAAVPTADVAIQAMRMLARLAPGVTHDGRNHLAGFSAFFGLLRQDDAFVAEYGTSLIESLEENARNAPELLSAFAALARERPPAPAPQPLRASIDQALRVTAWAMDVTQVVEVPPDLPDVFADASRLHHVLVAIIVNALDALGGPRPRGTVRLSASVVAGANPAAVELVIEDDAAPVSERDRVHLFDRVPPPGTTPRAGLDLAVVRHLVGLEGGTLRYAPAPGVGNRLVVTLPVTAEGRLGAMADHPDVPGRASDAGPARITVLVCDDDEPIRTLVVRVLQRGGHRVLQAESGAAALDILARDRVDVVLTDQRMTRMSGTELYAVIRERHPALGTRVLLMSGNTEDDALVTFAATTGLRVLGKPFPLADLDGIIRDLAAG